MIKKEFENRRSLKTDNIESDLVVVGGGMSGVCCSITAARAGISVTLVQDRPVLGGNASSEVRLWILGATSHFGNNNRWAREGGIIDEILVENMFRNPQGNSIIFDTILLEKVWDEQNITLLLNTQVYEVKKSDSRNIKSVAAFCSQNSTKYILTAPFFCDSSGDGIVAFQAGAPFRMGAEHREEFDEGFAPDVEDYGELLGHSIYFHSKDVGEPVNFVAPSFSLKNPEEIAKIRNYDLREQGCRLWWVEYGGRLDTIHQSEEIKWELWKVIYGIWDYVKNSGKYPEAKNLTLEWVGSIPGKRESRRFEGEYILTQQDVVEQREHFDAVAFGGWSLDLHPADGVYSEQSGCTQWHSKGIYQIPFRCYYSKSLENLFLAGRIISASHVAFGSTRVMATCAHGAQAVGMAAVLSKNHDWSIRETGNKENVKILQRELNKTGQSIPLIPFHDQINLVNRAKISTPKNWTLHSLPDDGPWINLGKYSAAQMLPFRKETGYKVKINVKAAKTTTLFLQFRTSSRQCNHTPDIIIENYGFDLGKGEHEIEAEFNSVLEMDKYVFICLLKNENILVQASNKRVTGILTVYNKVNKAVSNYGKQDPPKGIGIHSFEFWTPERRPMGHNFAFSISPGLDFFKPANVNNGLMRPTFQPNAWTGSWEEKFNNLILNWDQPVKINELILMFDTDFDHPMESVLMGHPEKIMPFCINNYNIFDAGGKLIYNKQQNHQTINKIIFDEPVFTDELRIEVERPDELTGPAIFEVLCF